MTVLVTGGAGYVGSALVQILADRGNEIRLLDDFSLSSPRNLMDAPPLEFVRGDIRDPETVGAAMADVETVIHLAAITGAEQSHDMRGRVVDVNTGGTEVVVDAAEAANVETLVFASSCNVYGDTHADYLTEADDPAPRNSYAESKLAGEEACRSADLDTVSLRLATNFDWSPGIRFNLVVNGFVFRALTGEPLTVYGDGTNWRPFMHVQDTARTLVDAIDWAPGVYNVAHDNYRIDTIAETIESVLDRPVTTDYLEDRDPGPSYHVDCTRARGQGFTTEYSLKAGVRDLADRFGRFANRPEKTIEP